MRRAWLGLFLLAVCRGSAPRVDRPAADAGVAAPGTTAIRILAPGKSAVDIERLLLPLEAAAGVARTRSIAVRGAGWLRVELADSRETTLRALQGAASHDIERLEVVADSPGNAPRLRYVIADPRRALVELRAIQDDLIAPRLATIPGVLEVRACGGARPSLRVEVDGRRLGALGVGVSDVTSALAGARAADVPEVVLRGGVRLIDVATVAQSARPTCFAHAGGASVLLGEVAVRDAAALAAVREALVAPQGTTVTALDDGTPWFVDLPGGVSDEAADRVVDAVARAVPGVVVELDRSPAALPRLPSELAVHIGRADPQAVAAAVARIPGVGPLRRAGEPAPTTAMEPELEVTADPARVAALGLSTREVDLAVVAARDGLPAGPARVWIPGGVTPSLPVGRVELGAVARIEARLVPAVIVRRAGVRSGSQP